VPDGGVAAAAQALLDAVDGRGELGHKVGLERGHRAGRFAHDVIAHRFAEIDLV